MLSSASSTNSNTSGQWPHDMTSVTTTFSPPSSSPQSAYGCELMSRSPKASPPCRISIPLRWHRSPPSCVCLRKDCSTVQPHSCDGNKPPALIMQAHRRQPRHKSHTQKVPARGSRHACTQQSSSTTSSGGRSEMTMQVAPVGAILGRSFLNIPILVPIRMFGRRKIRLRPKLKRWIRHPARAIFF